MHCLSGARSLVALSYLLKMGYDAVNVEKGINAVKEINKDIIIEAQTPCKLTKK